MELIRCRIVCNRAGTDSRHGQYRPCTEILWPNRTEASTRPRKRVNVDLQRLSYLAFASVNCWLIDGRSFGLVRVYRRHRRRLPSKPTITLTRHGPLTRHAGVVTPRGVTGRRWHGRPSTATGARWSAEPQRRLYSSD